MKFENIAKCIFLTALGMSISLIVYAAVPTITFVDPIPADNARVSGNSATVEVATTGNTVALDWNRSLVGWWRFNGESGESAMLFKDWSSYSNNAVCSGAICPAVVAGKFGKALQFDGVDDYAAIKNSADINKGNDITMSLWFKTAALQKGRFLLEKGTGDYLWGLYLTSDSKTLSVYIRNANGDVKSVSFSGSFDDNKWRHFAGTFDGRYIKLYLDGELKNAYDWGTIQTIETNNEDIVIGSWHKNQSFFDGLIDDARVYSRALVEGEIKSVYDSVANPAIASFSGLANGKYIFKFYGENSAGEIAATEQRTVNIGQGCLDGSCAANLCGARSKVGCWVCKADGSGWTSGCLNESWKIWNYGNENTDEWQQRLDITHLTLGCSDNPDGGCVKKEKYIAEIKNTVSSLSFAFRTAPSVIEDYALQYGRLSLSYPWVNEILFDDFYRIYKTWPSTIDKAAVLGRAIRNAKQQNSGLKFGITVYEDQVDNIGDLNLSQDIKNKIDSVHLYIHYRKNGVNYVSYVEKIKKVFPSAKIVAGAYVYDRMDRLVCEEGGMKNCTAAEEKKYYFMSLAIQADLLEKGNIYAIEMHPGYFGNDAGLADQKCKIGDAPCSVNRRAEFIKNSAEMRLKTVNMLDCYKSGVCRGKCGNTVCEAGETVANCGFDCGTGCQNECAAGAKRCSSSGVQTCAMSGNCLKWGAITNCPTGQICSGAGVCAPSACVVKTCAFLGNYECGSWSDGCGKMIFCGACAANKVCSAGKCASSCTGHSSKKCENGNLYWYNSCNAKEGLFQNCARDEATVNYRCSGNWIQRETIKKGCGGNGCTRESVWNNDNDCAAIGKVCGSGICIAQTFGGGGETTIKKGEPKPAIKMTRVEIIAKINEIAALIAKLQAQLKAMTGNSIYSCSQITRVLRYGMQNDLQVKCLQEALRAQGDAVIVSGNYDLATKNAVARFQQKYASEILTPYGLRYGSGNVGNATMAKVNALMVKQINNNF